MNACADTTPGTVRAAWTHRAFSAVKFGARPRMVWYGMPIFVAYQYSPLHRRQAVAASCARAAPPETSAKSPEDVTARSHVCELSIRETKAAPNCELDIRVVYLDLVFIRGPCENAETPKSI